MNTETSTSNPLRVGIGGPDGSGKTALCERLCLAVREHYDMAVVTNHFQPRAVRPHAVRDRRGRRRKDPAQGRAGHHPLGPPDHRQDPPRAPYAWRQRGDRPFLFTNLRSGEGMADVVAFVREQGLLDHRHGERP